MPAPSTTILTAAAIIDCISVNKKITPAQISKELGLNRANTHRMLNTLEIAGYVTKNRDNTYRLTFKLFELGNTVPHSSHLIDSAKPPMMRLEQRTGKTVTHAILYETEMIYIDKVDTDSKMHVDRNVGNTEPVYATSLGKAVAAFLPAKERDELIRSLSFVPFTSYTITDAERFRDELQKVREKGYALNDRELSMELCGIGAPVFGPSGRVVSAVSLSDAADRLQASEAEEVAAEMIRTCSEITENLKKLQ